MQSLPYQLNIDFSEDGDPKLYALCSVNSKKKTTRILGVYNKLKLAWETKTEIELNQRKRIHIIEFIQNRLDEGLVINKENYIS